MRIMAMSRKPLVERYVRRLRAALGSEADRGGIRPVPAAGEHRAAGSPAPRRSLHPHTTWFTPELREALLEALADAERAKQESREKPELPRSG